VEVFNKANTALVWHHGKLLALWEGGLPYEVRPQDLGTVGLETLGGAWKHAFTAHPKVDATTGELVFFGYSPLGRGVQCGVLDKSGRVVHTTSVPLPRSVMMHDCAITQHYTILLDLPMVCKLWRPFVGRPIYQFQPQCGARFGILPRYGDGRSTKWFDVEPCFVFHLLNAWEDGDSVIAYGCRFARAPFMLKKTRLAADEPTLDAVMYRWEFNLRTGEINEGPVDDYPAEFPRVDDALVGQAVRFGYATSLSKETSHLIKYDLSAGTQVRHECGAGRVSGEGVFVPRTDRTSEDDGYLLTLVHDFAEDQSELVVLDARRLDQPPIARVLLTQRVPAGFHGVWIDGREL
jgi:carotenoid cleavage dioxygenase